MSSKKAIAAAIAKAQAGVDYSPRMGAVCPCCGVEKLPVRNTLSWSGPVRVRFHLCENKHCLLYKLKQTVKSVELDRCEAV